MFDVSNKAVHSQCGAGRPADPHGDASALRQCCTLAARGSSTAASGRGTRGITLVELLVVMAIVSILAGLSIAGVASFTTFATDALQRSTRDVFTMLRAARIYASTYSVDTAVVYAMGPPISDSVTGLTVREFAAAAIMYQFPAAGDPLYVNNFVPIPGEQGSFKIFEFGTAVPFWDVSNPAGTNYFGSSANFIDPDLCTVKQGLSEFGMFPVRAVVPDNAGNLAPQNFAAHVFQSTGRMRFVTDSTPSCLFDTPERATMFVAPTANAPVGDRLIDPDILNGDRIYTPIHVFRSTGRSEIAS